MIDERLEATLDLVAWVMPRLIENLETIRNDALQRCGVTLESWREMSFDQREQALIEAHGKGAR